MHILQKMRRISDSATNKPLICVSLKAGNIIGIKDELIVLKHKRFDIIEIRADFYAGAILDDIKEIVGMIRKSFPEVKVMFTMRSRRHGGMCPYPADDIRNILLSAASFDEIDIIDVEKEIAEKKRAIIRQIMSNGRKVIISCHDYSDDFRRETIVEKLKNLKSFDADYIKYVISPTCEDDVYNLLSAVTVFKKAYPDSHLITHAMGDMGTISRVVAEFIGSEIAFAEGFNRGTIGQIDVNNMNLIVDAIHDGVSGN